MRLNVQGSEVYHPRLPWVSKVRLDELIACKVYIYVDDGRITGPTKLKTLAATRRLCSVISSLGTQDAARKRTEPSRNPGPWAGTISSTKGGVSISVSQERWEKTQGHVRELVDMVEGYQFEGARMDQVEDLEIYGEVDLNRERLEQIQGFLIYVSRTFKWMTPYLKGLHLTLDAWRPNRDTKTGWRLQYFHKDENGDSWMTNVPHPDAPKTVNPVVCFPFDVRALAKLVEGKEPAVQPCQVESAILAVYLMGDASREGFGSAIFANKRLDYQSGSWAKDFQDKSSNWREAKNLTS